MRLYRLFSFLLLLSLLAGCAPLQPTSLPAAVSNPSAPAANQPAGQSNPANTDVPANEVGPVIWPTKGWQTSSPEAQGVDAAGLEQAKDFAKKQNINLHSLLVIRNGVIVSETYYGSQSEITKHVVYSVTKSFISTLVGITLDRGKLTGLDQRVLDLLPGRTPANLDARKQAMTLENLLTMNSGLDCSDDTDINRLYASHDWVQTMLDLPMKSDPGQGFKYCSGVTHLISAVLQQANGQPTGDFAKANLLTPLGIANYSWEPDASGQVIGGWGLNLTPRDMAKLGYLYLHNGEWEGKQVVSASWVQAATQQHTQNENGSGYGYQWWVYPDYGAYAALGRDGQTVYVVPKLNLIVVTTAQTTDGHTSILKMIEDYILPAAGYEK